MSDELDQILQAFLQESLPQIERLITRALRDGRAISELAIDLERGIDEKVRGGCAPRGAVANRWRAHPLLEQQKRDEIADMILETSPNEVPVAMSIRTGRFTFYGVKRLEGDVVAPTKPN